MLLHVQQRKEALMRIRVQVIIESDQETIPPHIEEVACFERGPLTPETLGLRLCEAKQMLASAQQIMTTQQVEDYVEQQRQCPGSEPFSRERIKSEIHPVGASGAVSKRAWSR